MNMDVSSHFDNKQTNEKKTPDTYWNQEDCCCGGRENKTKAVLWVLVMASMKKIVCSVCPTKKKTE